MRNSGNKKNSSGKKAKNSAATLTQFPIVAIGASAGGLEAMTEFLKHLPSDTGMAFIYVQHLSPDHKSMLTQILSKSTKMKVQEIDNMDKIKPNNLFVIPHNKAIEIKDGHIKLIPRSTKSSANTIDILFTSLAGAQKERVIGIILSGSASDGSRGIKEIKKEGGLTFAQDESAKFGSMPQSAISTGFVDFKLSPKQIAVELAHLSKHPLVKSNGVKTRKEDLIDNNDPELQNILRHLFNEVGVDFSAYKMNTIKRRIIRRMLLHKIKTLKEYGKLLNEKSEETGTLYHDLLIDVTSFFRDSEAHKYLQTTILPKLIKSKKHGESLRIWIPACSTGEEVFSIAMMLLELQEGKSSKVPVQIFATDISQNSLSKARAGVFSREELENVSSKRIQRFFTKSDIGYRISKAVREMCIFAPHNILTDPPFSRIDLISCCNLFIYLDVAAQKKVVATFHYALNDNGYLLLGKSENISSSGQFFRSESRKIKIFSRRPNSGNKLRPSYAVPFRRPLINQEEAKKAKATSLSSSRRSLSVENGDLESLVNSVLVSEFLPSSVVVNHAMEIIQFRGSTELYLSHASGKASLNILKMARPEIAFDLRSAIQNAIKKNDRVRKNGIEIKVDTATRIINIEVVPLEIQWDEPLLLILFSEREQVDPKRNGGTAIGKQKDKARRIKKLEEELVAVQAESLAFAQEQEAFAEELQSANEEVVSSNEELQTINEELETSKEEIESINEELRTTNEEMQTRNELLNEAYEYSEAVTATIHDPMLILDKQLRVKSANKAFYKKFDVNENETEGVLVYDLGNGQWNIPSLREFLEEIILKNTYIRDYEVIHNFPHIGRKIMLLNASRIIQKTHREHLILLIIADITEMRMKTEELQRKEKELFNQQIEQQKIQSELLEETVKQRTSDLVDANAELQKKNNELSAFNYISSHDLQEPLRKIQAFTGRVIEKDSQNLTSASIDYLHRMQDAASRMQALINDLLAFSRLSTSQRKFEITDLAGIINDVKKELKEVIVEKKATIEIKETCQLKLIPFQFRQLMENLIGNALKFANPDRPPHIVINSIFEKSNDLSVSGLQPRKNYCHISITDNGIGFETEFKEKIFEVFQKLHGIDEYPGTGIGLAIVKKIVDNHNGIITATSELGEGATFDIYIPA